MFAWPFHDQRILRRSMELEEYLRLEEELRLRRTMNLTVPMIIVVACLILFYDALILNLFTRYCQPKGPLAMVWCSKTCLSEIDLQKF